MAAKKTKAKKPKDGTIKESTRDGKRAMVYMGGKWHHFGNNSKINQSKEQAEAAKARHRDALSGNDDRSKAYRKYWNKYWSKAKV